MPIAKYLIIFELFLCILVYIGKKYDSDKFIPIGIYGWSLLISWPFLYILVFIVIFSVIKYIINSIKNQNFKFLIPAVIDISLYILCCTVFSLYWELTP